MTRLVEVHDAMWDEWWLALAGLPRSKAHRRVGGSYPSLFLTARHMVDAETYWQDRLEGVDRPEAPLARSMADLQRAWTALRRRRSRWLAKGAAARRVTFVVDDGATASASAWECLLHVVTHAHFHRGQLASQCRILGVCPPERHLMGYFIGLF